MTRSIKADICIIGAGSGGLSVAAGAAQLGARTVLIEHGKMGGDCLNYGCVPSKSLLAAGHAAARPQAAAALGVDFTPPSIDAQRVHDHVRDVIAGIAPHDSIERFEGLGCTVLKAHARFVAPDTVEADGTRVIARRFVVATGSTPLVPPIPGLDTTPYLTNETIFDLARVPAHLIIVGGGPIGIEMAQAHRQLGARVSVLEMGSMLPKDDPELVAFVRGRLKAEGIELIEGARVTAVAAASGVEVTFERAGSSGSIAGSHLLIAAGRRPTVGDLGLEAAGVTYSTKGITVDSRLRTSNRRIFAIGDVTGGYQFTHVAGYHAGIVIRNALFRIPAKVDRAIVPWVTYTDPELAQVGLTEGEARQRHGDRIRVLRANYGEIDRARAERIESGLAKVITTRRGEILGAGIAGSAAGELIQTWILAMASRLKIGAVATMIAPYPTLGEINKRVAGSFYTPLLFSRRSRLIVRLLSWFG